MKFLLFYKIVLITSVLSACAPTNYVYVKPNGVDVHKIDEVVVMVEYLNVKEGFDSYWDFNENINLENQDELYNMAVQILTEKGYGVSDKSLKTSGIVVDRNFVLDHFLDKKKQKQLIAPPYIVRSVNLQDENIQGFEFLLAELNSPMSAVMADLRTYVNNNYKQQMDSIDLNPQSAVLVIQVYKPRKAMLPNIEFAVTSSVWDTHVDFGSIQPASISAAYLIHNGSGDVLWSNKSSYINTKKPQKFFAELPKR